MSWFKRKPPKYPPHKPHPLPHRTSPSTEKTLDDAKKTGPNYDVKTDIHSTITIDNK